MRPVRSGTGVVVAPGNVSATRAATPSAWRGSTSSISLAAVTCAANRGEQRPVGVEPVLAAEERPPRFEVAHIPVDRLELLGGDVGRVADDEVERALEPVGPRALDELDVDAERGRIGAGHLERGGADVGGDGTRGRNLGGERDGDAPAAGPEVGDAQLGAGPVAQIGHRTLHQRLGVGPGHEHVGRDPKRPPVELAGPGDVRHRFALPAPPDQLADRGQLLLVERPVELQVQVDAAQPERLRAEQLRSRDVPTSSRDPPDRSC